eukprot:TRINITY_DN67357_c0_g1_i1.p1 TRINITY_DN67357_c0_g1~~TRINITY_DN67357_c0_g1_i1.p1  ORF type:complete len:485 (+),score=271.21 TRINITY_DN67357_c0_g1_i1:39-1493(+)
MMMKTMVLKSLLQRSVALGSAGRRLVTRNIKLSSASTAKRWMSASSSSSSSSSGSSSSSSEREPTEYDSWSDEDVAAAVRDGRLKFFNLERDLEDFERAVRIRRSLVAEQSHGSFDDLPYEHYNYERVHGQCAENVIGYVPIPVGVAGPLKVDDKEFLVPLATTEGALVASTTRGCKAITESGGCKTYVTRDAISRAPVLQAPSSEVAVQVKQFVEEHLDQVQEQFNSTSRFARLQEVKAFVAGRLVYLRFRASTGDAMGMNMVSKGTDKALDFLTEKFPVDVLALSGNVCTDKKPSAINWIEGRGKSIICEAVITGDVVKNVLKTTVDDLVHLNYAKNLVGSAVAGSIGGMNAHAANIVTAAFLACGQDPAQNVESSTCMTLIEKTNNGKDVYISVTMPSMEVGTIGGGTILPGQSACLNMLGVKGSNHDEPGANARQLARVISGAVLAGELSLMSALSAGHLIRSHLALNRKSAPAQPTTDN